MSTNLFNPADQRKYPSRWTMHRGKSLFQIIEKFSVDGSEELLSVSHITGITPRSQKNVTMFESESLVGYKLCEIGDIVANTMWTWQGAIGVSRYGGVVSPSYNVYRQKANIYNPRFLDMLLRERKLVDVYHSLSTGIRPSRLRLYPDVFLTIKFPVPPRSEQDRIVRYLDWQVSKTNKLIAAKKKEISLLRDQRQKEIDSAVLGECKKDADMPWGLAIPDGWNIIKFNGYFTFKKGLSITKKDLREKGIDVISYGQVHSKQNTGTEIDDSLIRFVEGSYLETSPNALVKKGDFIFADTSEDFEGVGNCVFVDRDDTIFAGYHTLVACPKDGKPNRYLAYLFKSSFWRYQLRKRVNGVKVYSITQRILKNAFVLLPPETIQNNIVEYLDGKCRNITAAIDRINAEIETLEELKRKLISDVVTGQIDVRSIEVPDFEYEEDIEDTSEEDEVLGEEFGDEENE